MALDFRDFYITWLGHPRYKEDEIIQQDPIYVIVQKIEMCLFTNKGEFIGDIDFGCDLEFYLWQTTISPESIKNIIQDQFNLHIPELINYNYTLNVSLMEGTLQDILVVDITLNDIGIKAIFR
jgi:hypothetical protein